ncbi:hypothetical protein J6590_013266 [Homalodisca vitripennis]|nr:hypothetical protein J6590_013266 [Homalodisca vitripennis]
MDELAERVVAQAHVTVVGHFAGFRPQLNGQPTNTESIELGAARHGEARRCTHNTSGKDPVNSEVTGASVVSSPPPHWRQARSGEGLTRVTLPGVLSFNTLRSIIKGHLPHDCDRRQLIRTSLVGRWRWEPSAIYITFYKLADPVASGGHFPWSEVTSR